MGTIRLLLAAAVVIGHSSPIFGVSLIPGDDAVRLFFVISGFYMALILSSKYHNRRIFYLNRFLRLYPTYVIVLLCTWLWFFFVWFHLGRLPGNGWVASYRTMPIGDIIAIGISNWTMLGLDVPSLFHYSAQHGFMFMHYPHAANAPDGSKWAGEFRTIGQAWSIGVEIWFYMIAPFIIRWRNIWLAALGSVSIFTNVYMNYVGFGTYFFFPSELIFFIIGIMLYRFYDRYGIANTPIWTGYGLLCVAASAILLCHYLPSLQTEKYVVFITVIPLIPFIFGATRKNSIDHKMGNLSYPIYIVHLLVMGVILSVIHSRSGILTLSASIVAAAALLYFVEEPVDRLRQRLATRKQAAVTMERLPLPVGVSVRK